jgi:hypothetical protein
VEVGDSVTFGMGVNVGDYAAIGDDVSLGSWTTVGAKARISHYTKIGSCTHLGEEVILGKGVRVGAASILGRGVILGPTVTLGEHVSLPDGMTSDQLNEELCLAVEAHEDSCIFWVWATRAARKAPEFSGLRSGVVYRQGATLSCPRAVRSDQLWAPGLIVFRVGMRTKYVGICYNGPEELIPLCVEVDACDILHAGFPGAPPLSRVRKLKVLD